MEPQKRDASGRPKVATPSPDSKLKLHLMYPFFGISPRLGIVQEKEPK